MFQSKIFFAPSLNPLNIWDPNKNIFCLSHGLELKVIHLPRLQMNMNTLQTTVSKIILFTQVDGDEGDMTQNMEYELVY